MALLRVRNHMNLSLKLPKQNLKVLLPPIQNPDFSWCSREVQSLSDVEKLETLGSGNGGTVFKARHKLTGKIYALKVIRCDKLAHQEIEILTYLKDHYSPNIIQCYGVFQQSCGDIAIIMEYMDVGSLQDIKKSRGAFPEDVVSYIARQILIGLNHIHADKKIAHRDIKPANLLVNGDYQVKIADFGVSKVVKNNETNTFVGTSAYMSPERLGSRSHDDDDNNAGALLFAGDIWSLGISLMELYLGRHPYITQPSQDEGERDNTSFIWEICFGECPRLNQEEASTNFRDFINCCLQKDWTKRWTASQLLSHPFLAPSS